MGIDSERFVECVPQDALCVVCCLVLENPIETSCGHFACRGCWEKWDNENKSDENQSICLFCGIIFEESEVKDSKLAWSLISNLNVYCQYKSSGCDSVFKLCFADIHESKCIYAVDELKAQFASSKVRCSNCGLDIDAGNQTHDCLRLLHAKNKEQATQLTNADLEKSGISFKFMQREKLLLDRLADLEVQYHLETLKYNKDLRELRTRIFNLQTKEQSDTAEQSIELLRINGSLGFNIIGGASKDGKGDNRSSGIFVSRIVAGGAADQPGKLKLHDQIMQVDGCDMRNATHEEAVQAFRRSGDPVNLVIQRHIVKDSSASLISREVSTQTVGGVMFVVTGEEADVIGPDEKSQEQYDSAYDTLLTQKSYRSSRMSVFTETSDVENTSQSVTPEPISLENISTIQNKVQTSTNSNELQKRHSAYYVIPDNEATGTEGILADLSKVWLDNETDCEKELEYEYEYEEVRLVKNGSELGILLCYGGDETDVSVYVGDIEENSVADICGLIMVGDQIIKINDTHVQDVEEAYKLLQEKDDINLVVARPLYDIHSNSFMADEPETDLDLDYLESIKEEPSQICKENRSTSSSKSSSSSSSSSPAKNIICSNEKNSLINEHNIQALNSALSPTTRPRSSSMSSNSSALSKESKKSKSRSQSSDNNNNLSNKEDLITANKITSSHSERSEGSRDNSKERPEHHRDSKTFSRKLEHANDCNTSSSRHGSSSSRNSNSKNKYSDNETLKIHKRQTSHKDVRHYSPSVSSIIRNSLKNSTHNNLRSALRPDKHLGQKAGRQVQIDPHPGWNETERKVWEEFKIIQRIEAAERDSADPLRPLDVEAAWCVRRSKDGKHVYIKKTNDSRNKQLKERARQINDERGITTDDDAFTVYQGRYWNKNERRKQLIRHQEKKRRLMQKINEREMIDHSLERDMAELVQRKMTIPSRVFDDFLTVEEVFAQRNRSGACTGPIHVTTI